MDAQCRRGFIESSKKAVELAEKYKEGVYAAVGAHPHEIRNEKLETRDEIFDYEFFLKLAKNPKVVAIGECGLDYYFNQQPTINDLQQIKQKQKELFIKHIELAKEIGKPLMIHCRDAPSASASAVSSAPNDSGRAFPDLINILQECFLRSSAVVGVIHFFTGTLDDAKKLLEIGFYFTFGGLITYNRAFDEAIEHIPIDKLLAETDAPYVAPEPYRGQRNEPSYIIEVVKKIAEIKNVPFDKLCEKIVENNRRIFKI